MNLTNNNAINILSLHMLCSSIIRLAYAVWMVEEVIKANESTNNELYFMYDIACTLHSHLCVSHCSSIFFKVYNFGLSTLSAITAIGRFGGYYSVFTYFSLIWPQSVLSGVYIHIRCFIFYSLYTIYFPHIWQEELCCVCACMLYYIILFGVQIN